MELAKLFSESNCLHKEEAACILDKYYKLISWSNGKQDAKVLDIGCGTGETTVNVLLPYLPVNIGSLTGGDVSDAMLDFARLNCSHDKVSYIKLDLRDVPVNLEGYYDTIFSFYCVNWIKCHRLAFSNIHKLLKVGGSIMIVSLARTDVYNAYRYIATLPKYAQYMQDVDAFIPNCNSRCDFGLIISRLLVKLGFKVQVCDVHDRVYEIKSLKVFRDLMKSVNAFLSRIPLELQEDFITEIVNYQISERYEEGECVPFPYTAIVIVAEKLR